MNLLLTILFTFILFALQAQHNPESDQKSIALDTTYIASFPYKNDVRVNYGSKGSSLMYGSERNTSSTAVVFNNVNDIIGFGFTYKILDFDFYFSLPQTRLLNEGVQNLQQFRISGSYFARRWTLQGYWRNSQGLLVTDAGENFRSSPDVHLGVLSAQFTYNFNFRKYSFKAAYYQNELQRKSAGSFLVRIEPFYRNIGIGNLLVPATFDTPTVYGEQVGLQYVHSPGINILPGYGYNLAIQGGRYFVSTIILLGGGAAFTYYKSNEDHFIFNPEWAGMMSFNFGYSGQRVYAAIRSSYESHYFNLKPSYFVTSDIRIGFTAGYRFNDFEKIIPRL